jgi:hypothetical protein
MNDTQTITKLKQIAQKHGLLLDPIDVMESHGLYLNGSIKCRYENARLESMTADEFTAICERHTRPVKPAPFDAQAAMLQAYITGRAVRSPITGHFRGGER